MPSIRPDRRLSPSRLAWVGLVLFGLLLSAPSALADEVEKTFPFELGEWQEVDFQDGPITIHRVRLEPKESNLKSKVLRPGGRTDPMVRDVQIQVEYSNERSSDIEATLEIFWFDSKGRRIDGYEGTEDMNDEKRYERMTALRSTLVYGLDVAKKLKVRITW